MNRLINPPPQQTLTRSLASGSDLVLDCTAGTETGVDAQHPDIAAAGIDGHGDILGRGAHLHRDVVVSTREVVGDRLAEVLSRRE